MKKAMRISLIFLVICTLLIGATPGKANELDGFAQVMDERMAELLAKYGVPGAVAAYIRNGEVAWSEAYGEASRVTHKPMATDMIFNFGSTGKVLTGWGVMRLVEQGKLNLDAPINQYLKRWQLKSAEYDPDQVTIRRLLSHTAGLTVSGFTDFSLRRSLPSLVEMLEGQNQSDGKVVLFQTPGTGYQYSGGGYLLLQMIIEDVTGESFEAYMAREITGPLGMPSLHWTWTPELMKNAPTIYGPQQEPLGYRQLGSLAIGSEIGTVPEYARFVAACVSGPANEPPGRGVLSPESIAQMTTIQPNAKNEGLAYAVTYAGNGKLLEHFGANNGWNAFFTIHTGLREGLVVANNSANGFPLNAAIQNLWLEYLRSGDNRAFEPQPEAGGVPLSGMVMLALAGLLAVALVIDLLFLAWNVRSGKRAFKKHVQWQGWTGILAWGAALIFWIYWFYTPLPLPFPTWFPDFWRIPQVDLVTALLVIWSIVAIGAAHFPRTALTRQG